MPKISVVMVSINGSSALDECLEALSRQRGNVESEVIVVSYCQNNPPERVRGNLSQVKFLSVADRPGIPELRARGMACASGDIVAITEDCCIPNEHWYEEILKAYERGYDVVGGAVINGSQNGLVNWAVYLCEYSQSLPPIPEGEVFSITGNNAAYRKEILDKVDDSIKRHYWEFFLHQELRKKGVRLFSIPAMIVKKKKEYRFLYFLTQRFYYSRSFAGMRSKWLSIKARLALAFLTPLLPPLLIWRMARQVARKKLYRGKFALSLPLLASFMISYALGEFIGYIFGPGRSLMKVE